MRGMGIYCETFPPDRASKRAAILLLKMKYVQNYIPPGGFRRKNLSAIVYSSVNMRIPPNPKIKAQRFLGKKALRLCIEKRYNAMSFRRAAWKHPFYNMTAA